MFKFFLHDNVLFDKTAIVTKNILHIKNNKIKIQKQKEIEEKLKEKS